MKKITIIGITDQSPHLSKAEMDAINHAGFFAGGKRHYELVGDFLPSHGQWYNIVAPLQNLFTEIRNSQDNWVIFASGDPLFFGIGNTLKREFPGWEIEIFPTFNSLQLLAHRFGLNYGEFTTISLTGRPWKAFDDALVRGTSRMGILTDREKTPATIAERMLAYGYENYTMFYGEHLGGSNEKVARLSMREAAEMEFQHPNCFFLKKTDDSIPRKGITDEDFEPLDGRPKMITKMPVRLATLALMQLNRHEVFWDIGACTGSVSIEARLQHPRLGVTAFEIRPESEGIILRNVRKFQAPGINQITGSYLDVDKTLLDAPDAVFLGGYGGEMEKILDDVHQRLQPGGVIAFNSVSQESKNRFMKWCQSHQYKIEHQQIIKTDDNNPIHVLIAGRAVSNRTS